LNQSFYSRIKSVSWRDDDEDLLVAPENPFDKMALEHFPASTKFQTEMGIVASTPEPREVLLRRE